MNSVLQSPWDPFSWYCLLNNAPPCANLQAYRLQPISLLLPRHESGIHMPRPAVVPNFRSALVRLDAIEQTLVKIHAGRHTGQDAGCPIIVAWRSAELYRP